MKRIALIILILILSTGCRAITGARTQQKGGWIQITIIIDKGDKDLNAPKRTDLKGDLRATP